MKEMRFGPVRFIPGENRGRYPFCHSIYIEGEGILIDPASDRKRLERLRAEGGVKAVWLSHWHEDHFMHLDLFDNLPLWISRKDAPPLSDLDVFLDWYGLDNAEHRQFWKQTMLEQFHFRPRSPHGFFEDGDVIRLGSLTVDVIATPGHTPGHVAFFFREPRVLFLGDYDLTRFGPWYGDLYSSIEDTIASIARLKKMNAGAWLAGHEAGVFESPPGPLWDQYEGVIYEREGRLLDALDRPHSLDEIAGRWLIYGRPREPLAFYEFGERALVKKHLGNLQRRGLVRFEGGRYVKSGDELSEFLQAHTCGGGRA